MTSLFESAWVIARRDFIATVYSKSFILFLLVPLIIFASALFVGQAAGRSERAASQPVIALIADNASSTALMQSRTRLAAGTSERTFPMFERVAPAERVEVQARHLLADDEAGYSAVLSGTLERPVLIGPVKVDQWISSRVQLILDEARLLAAMEQAGLKVPEAGLERLVTDQAAGNLQMVRRNIAEGSQGVIFMITVMLATLLLSNLAEEKSNKIIEVLAAAVPLDAVFLGKLIAMLGISLVGLALWGSLLATGYLFLQVIQDWVTLPEVAPAVGWPLFILLVLIYYGANYMLLGALFLGIGGQASNIREIQTLSMPVTLLQVFVFLLAMSAVGNEGGWQTWTAYILPFSSPLSMVALAAQDPRLWPHAVALLWQLLWIVLIIRVSARLFRMTVLKSTPPGSFFGLGSLLGPKKG